MSRLGDVLPRVLQQQPDASRLYEVQLQIAFRKVLGDQLSRQCEEVTVHGSTLSVTTQNPALAHQLRLDARTFLTRLGEESGQPGRVRELRVRTGRGRGSSR